MAENIRDLRNRLMRLTTWNMGDHSDAELREIKNTAEVFAMHIRMELAARDARMVDQACALEADGEKLRQMTGEDHGPWTIPEDSK